MHPSARQVSILKALETQGICTVIDLATQLEVSDETIRRDIKAMATKGLVQRVHGGVHLPGLLREPAFQKRLSHNADAKRAIARRAAENLADGDSVMLDTGSTTSYVAQALVDRSDLMVITNCSKIAGALASGNRNKVYLSGGEFRGDDAAVFGPSAIAFVQQFRVRLAILSIGAINLEDGLMDFHLAEAEFSQAVIGRANRVMVVADHSKFSLQAPVRVCGLSSIDVLVTDKAPPQPFVKALAKAGVALQVAEAL